MSNLERAEIDSALASVDAFAAQRIALAAPIRFDVAQSPAELEAVYRLRYQVAIERGWATPADMPDGLERDAYDDRAVQIVGWDKEGSVAVVRLVFPHSGL